MRGLFASLVLLAASASTARAQHNAHRPSAVDLAVAFAMIPHHRGAISTAQALLATATIHGRGTPRK